jgi:Tol biopolymer transport system component
MSLEDELTQPLAVGGPENYAPSWSPDGQWLAYQSRLGSVQSEIWIVDRNGRNARRLTNTPSGAWSRAPSWSPDGQWLAYVSSQNGSIDSEHGEVFVIPVSGGDAQQVTFTGGSVYNWRADWGP